MTAIMPPHSQVRDCRLYRIRVYHPDDMHLPPEQRRIVLGYVGETLRQPLVRLMEHINDQPWSDTIVGWDLDPRVFAGKDAVLAAEAAAIRAEKPLYNVKGNEAYPGRIPPPVAIRQRRDRDLERGLARWSHPADRPPSGTPVRPGTVPSSWSPVRVKACLWSAAWMLTAVVTGGLCARHTAWVWWVDASAGAVTSAVLLGWGLWRRPDTWPMWRRRLKRLRGWL